MAVSWLKPAITRNQVRLIASPTYHSGRVVVGMGTLYYPQKIQKPNKWEQTLMTQKSVKNIKTVDKTLIGFINNTVIIKLHHPISHRGKI